MGGLRRLLIVWFLLFLIFFLIVAAVVWLASRDSGCPPPGEYTVTRVIRLTGPSFERYEISFEEGREDRTLKISSSRIKVETFGDLRQATLSVDEDGVSLNLPTSFEIQQGSILFSVTFAAFIFSLVLAIAYFIRASYLPRG